MGSCSKISRMMGKAVSKGLSRVCAAKCSLHYYVHVNSAQILIEMRYFML